MKTAEDILLNLSAHTVNRDEKLQRSIEKRNSNEVIFRSAMSAAANLGEFDKAKAMGYGKKNKNKGGD